MDNIENLYKCYEVLSEAGDKITEVSFFFNFTESATSYDCVFQFFTYLQHINDYKEILKAVKGTSKEKRLASQFIGKFFKHFPDLADEAIDAQLDLCEDDDMQVCIYHILSCTEINYF